MPRPRYLARRGRGRRGALFLARAPRGAFVFHSPDSIAGKREKKDREGGGAFRTFRWRKGIRAPFFESGS